MHAKRAPDITYNLRRKIRVFAHLLRCVAKKKILEGSESIVFMRKKPSTSSREFSHLVCDGQGLRLERGSFRFELRHLVGVTECQTDVIEPFHQPPPREIVHFEGNDVL